MVTAATKWDLQDPNLLYSTLNPDTYWETGKVFIHQCIQTSESYQLSDSVLPSQAARSEVFWRQDATIKARLLSFVSIKRKNKGHHITLYLGGYMVKIDVPKVLNISTAPELYETPTIEQSADQATRRHDGNGSKYTVENSFNS